MANELQVIVRQEPGVVTWNFEQLKASLAEMMSSYENMVYTDESITVARQDLAGLRKLKGAVEDKRKEIRRKCLEPYTVIEDQAKELTSLIDRPIDAIGSQVKSYEETQKGKRRAEIKEYMQKAFSDFPSNLAAKLAEKTYDARWENATTTKKTWKQAIDAATEHTSNDLKILEGIDDDFRAEAVAVYMKDLQLAQAIQKAQEMERQREIIRQRERERLEAEARRREELEKLRQKLETAEKEAKHKITLSDSVLEIPVPEPVKMEQKAVQTTIPTPQPQAVKAQAVRLNDGTMEKVIRIRGSEKQISRIIGFIKYAGATYEEA